MNKEFSLAGKKSVESQFGTAAEHCRGEQAVVRWQQPLHGLSVNDLEGEEGGVPFNDEAHVRIGARASVYDVALDSQRQLAEHGATLGRGRDLSRHDHLLGSLDIASRSLICIHSPWLKNAPRLSVQLVIRTP